MDLTSCRDLKHGISIFLKTTFMFLHVCLENEHGVFHCRCFLVYYSLASWIVSSLKPSVVWMLNLLPKRLWHLPVACLPALSFLPTLSFSARPLSFPSYLPLCLSPPFSPSPAFLPPSLPLPSLSFSFFFFFAILSNCLCLCHPAGTTVYVFCSVEWTLCWHFKIC